MSFLHVLDKENLQTEAQARTYSPVRVEAKERISPGKIGRSAGRVWINHLTCQFWAVYLLLVSGSRTNYLLAIYQFPRVCTRIRRNSSSVLITSVFSLGECRKYINGMEVDVMLLWGKGEGEGKVKRWGSVERWVQSHYMIYFSWNVSLTPITFLQWIYDIKKQFENIKRWAIWIGLINCFLLRMHLFGERISVRPALSLTLQMLWKPPLLMHTCRTR